MPSITSAAELKLLIHELELKKNREEFELKQSAENLLEHLKPINIIRDTLQEISTSPEVKQNLIDNGIMMATEFLTKKILVKESQSPFKKWLSSAAQASINSIVENNIDSIKTMGADLFSRIFSKRKKKHCEC